jgi:hypothetical protein
MPPQSIVCNRRLAAQPISSFTSVARPLPNSGNVVPERELCRLRDASMTDAARVLMLLRRPSAVGASPSTIGRVCRDRSSSLLPGCLSVGGPDSERPLVSGEAVADETYNEAQRLSLAPKQL